MIKIRTVSHLAESGSPRARYLFIHLQTLLYKSVVRMCVRARYSHWDFFADIRVTFRGGDRALLPSKRARALFTYPVATGVRARRVPTVDPRIAKRTKWKKKRVKAIARRTVYI